MFIRKRAMALCGAALLALTACAADGPQEPQEGTTGEGTAEQGKIAVLLPDSKSSARWEGADRVFLQQAFEDAGLTSDQYIISNAEGDTAQQANQADQAITDGAKVLLLVNLDNAPGAAIIDKAHEAGVTVIDYDRLTLGGKADYYVSGDATEAGRLQGQGIVDDLEAAGTDEAKVAIIGGSPTDSFATDLETGYHEVLDPLVESGQIEIIGEQRIKDWDGATGLTTFEQMLTANNNEVDAVVAANDTMANATISALKAQNLDPVPTSGLDGEIKALQHILAGDQTFTVYFSYKTQATIAGELAVQLLRGETPDGDLEVDNEGHMIPMFQISPEVIRKDNISVVVDDGLASWDEICVGEYEQYCPDN